MKKRRDSKYESKAVHIRRVAKVTSGGKRLRFSAMVVVGDRNGTVGVALGRGVDTRSAIEKGTRKAEKNAVKIQLIGDTIPHEVLQKNGASKILLRPAKPGTGVIAGSSVRAVLELCGVENVYGKVLGSSDLTGNTYTTFDALKSLRSRRVLEKMQYMRDRVNLKEQLDKERKKREAAMRKKAQESGGKDKHDRRRGGRRPRHGSHHKRGKPQSDMKKGGQKADKPNTTDKSVKSEKPKTAEKPKAATKPEAKPAKTEKPKAATKPEAKPAKTEKPKAAAKPEAKPKDKKESK